MGSSTIQGKLWGASATDWSQLVEPHFTPLFDAVLDAVGAGPGVRLLDAGCGSGLALQLARRRGAVVSGLDAADALLAVARERVPDGDLRHGDLEELPFGDGGFDAVIACNSVQYATDPVAALRELRRVAAGGAPVAVVAWGDPARCDTRAALAAIGGLLPPPPPGAGGPFALSEPGKLEELVAAAGLAPEGAQEVEVAIRSTDLDEAVRGTLASGPARVAIERAGEAAVAGAVREALAPTCLPDGTSVQRNVFRYVLARA